MYERVLSIVTVYLLKRLWKIVTRLLYFTHGMIKLLKIIQTLENTHIFSHRACGEHNALNITCMTRVRDQSEN